MKNKRCDSVKNILAKNARSSGGSIIHFGIYAIGWHLCDNDGRSGAVGE